MSAEIFVVCQGYLAPDKIDPKLLEAKYVFKELDEPVQKQDIIHPEKHKRQREGYEEGNMGMYKECPVDEFIMG